MPLLDSSPARAAASLTVLSLLGAPSLAAAQDSPAVELQNFHPIVGPYGVFSVEGSQVIRHLAPAAGLMLNYTSEPLVARDGDDVVPIVNQQLALHAQAGVGLFDRLQLDLALPLYLVNDAAWRGEDISGFAVGDMSARLKGRLLEIEQAPVGLAAAVDVRIPTGNQDVLVAGGAAATPELIADAAFGPVYLAANLGAELRQERDLGDLSPGSAFTYGVGGELRLLEGMLALGGEIFGRAQFDDFAAASTSPIEGVVGAKLHTPGGFSVVTGAGGGLLPGLGAPSFRSFVGLTYAMPAPAEEQAEPSEVTDADGDGLPADLDQCPNEPEDLDTFEDDDGCPDPDNDQDGVPDVEDQCPLEPGVSEQGGCPAPEPPADTDGDGVADAEDQCPDEAGDAARQGCPKRFTTLLDTRIRVNEKIYFETNSAEIQPRSLPILDEIALLLEQHPRLRKVEVAGHTDSAGDAEANLELSQRRAEAVVAYLVSKGVAPERLVAKGYGDTRPITQESSELERARNRRVEFLLLEADPVERPASAVDKIEAGVERAREEAASEAEDGAQGSADDASAR